MSVFAYELGDHGHSGPVGKYLQTLVRQSSSALAFLVGRTRHRVASARLTTYPADMTTEDETCVGSSAEAVRPATGRHGCTKNAVNVVVGNNISRTGAMMRGREVSVLETVFEDFSGDTCALTPAGRRLRSPAVRG